MLFVGVCLRDTARTAATSRTNLSSAHVGPEVGPPSVFHRHNCIDTLPVAIFAGSSREISLNVRMHCRSFLSRVCISVRPNKLVLGESPPKPDTEAA